MMKYIITFVLLVHILACNNDINPEKEASRLIIDYLHEYGITDYSITTFKADSFYLPVQFTDTYKEAYSSLNEDYYKLKKEIDDYNQWLRLFRETPINGGLVALYQKFIRDKINELDELDSIYKPIYKGIRVPLYIEYKTAFKDSVMVVDLVMNDRMDSITYLNVIHDSFPKEYMFEYYESVNIDTISNFIDKCRFYSYKRFTDIDTSFFIKPILRN